MRVHENLAIYYYLKLEPISAITEAVPYFCFPILPLRVFIYKLPYIIVQVKSSFTSYPVSSFTFSPMAHNFIWEAKVPLQNWLLVSC